jgi:hypothetical protein
MAKNDIFLYAILGVGFLVFYYKFDGKNMINNLINEVKGGLSSGGGGGGSQINTGDNISGNADVNQIQSQVQGMLEKMGVHGSGESISRTRQVDTTGQAVQKQSHKQSSNVFYTIPRFGNL